MEAQKMIRGSQAMNNALSDLNKVSVRQTRRGCFQELLGCEAKSEFKYFKDGTDQLGTSLEDSECCVRIFCPLCRPFTMEVKDMEGAEILTVDRPFACGPTACKCCCYQTMSFKSGGQDLGKIEEQYYYCVPVFKIYQDGNYIYKIHSPTCLGGLCVNCCAEGNPCFGKGCCKVPYHIFPASQENTDDNAPHSGKILKLPKSMMTEILTDANAFDVTFPEDANNSQKAMIMGTAIFLNALFFEGNEES